MAASSPKSGCRGLRTLPTEILLEITKYITDFPSLNGFLTLVAAHNRGVSFVEDFQTEIFANVIRAGREYKLSRVVTAVMTLRNDSLTKRILSILGAASENFLYKFLRSDDRERDGRPHYLQLFSNPIATIRDIWKISEDIEALVEDFAQTRIVKPSQQPEKPSSSTELYRIRRAFWHFQLSYELIQAEESMPHGIADEAQSPHSRRYVHYRTHQFEDPCFPNTGWLYGHKGRKLSRTMHCCVHSIPSWAVEEIEAVRFHLASLVNAFQYQSQGKTASLLSRRPALLQRLISDLDHWREDKENPVDHLLVADLGSKHDEPPIANKEQWGWAMWDAERLTKRGLKSDSQRKNSSRLSDRAFRRCKDAHSTYIDRWVAEKFKDDVRCAKEEKAKREEQKRSEEDDLKFYPFALGEMKATSKRAQRKARALARDFGKTMKEMELKA